MPRAFPGLPVSSTTTREPDGRHMNTQGEGAGNRTLNAEAQLKLTPKSPVQRGSGTFQHISDLCRAQPPLACLGSVLVIIDVQYFGSRTNIGGSKPRALQVCTEPSIINPFLVVPLWLDWYWLPASGST